MNLVVKGMACLGSFGNSLADLRAAHRVANAPLQPAFDDGRAAQADVSGLKEHLHPRAMRQLDHFTRMALLGAFRALHNAGWGDGASGEFSEGSTGIVLATGYGPAAPTFSFLDSIIAHGELMASPLAFSHSVHNIPAASIAMKLGLTGPCTTVCQPECPVGAGLLTAREWLLEGRARRVLFGAVDECTPLLAEVSTRLTQENALMRASAESSATALDPAFKSRGCFPLSEGAAFFCLTAPDSVDGTDGQGAISRIGMALETLAPGWQERLCQRLLQEMDPSSRAALYLSGAVPPFTAFPASVFRAIGAYGNIPVAQAFDLALALGASEAHSDSPANGSCCLSLGSRGLAGMIQVSAGTAPSENAA